MQHSALRREAVLDMQRDRAQVATNDEAFRFERLQPGGQNARRDFTRQRTSQRTESDRFVACDRPDNVTHPSLRKKAQETVETTTRSILTAGSTFNSPSVHASIFIPALRV